MIPFAGFKLRPEVRAFGETLGAEFVDLSGDLQGYFKLMTRLWAPGEPRRANRKPGRNCFQ